MFLLLLWRYSFLKVLNFLFWKCPTCFLYLFLGELLHIFNIQLIRYFFLLLSCFSRVQLFVTPWTVVYLAPLSMEFSRQEYWSGLPCPSPGDFPDPKTKPCSLRSPALQADSLPLSRQGSPITSSVAAILIFLHILQLYWFPYALNIVFLSHLLQ